MSTGQGVLGGNMWAYCGNNPINRYDDGGEFWHLVAGAVIGAIVGTVVSVISQQAQYGSVDLATTLIAAGAGALNGALTASGFGIAVQAVGGAAIAMASNAGQQARGIALDHQESFSVDSMLVDGAIGGICGAVSGAGASSIKSGAGGQRHMINLGVNTIKRTSNALKYGGVQGYVKEAVKATSYYLKSTVKITRNLGSARVIASQIIGGIYSAIKVALAK
jgi:hypothetical protein